MKIIVCENYEEMSAKCTEIFAELIKNKPDCTLGLATGSTPEGLYANLADLYEKGELDFSKVKSYNLDEYYPIKATNDQSYRYFMNDKLFNHINIDKANTFVPNGEAEDPVEECKRYEKMLDEVGGVDIQLLGIGQNGHIGFNEPDEKLCCVTHLTGLTESTINANARFFNDVSEVPTKALTMGIGSIFKATKVVLLASGKSKKDAIAQLLDDSLTTSNPATMLKLHSDLVIICDKDAYGE